MNKKSSCSVKQLIKRAKNGDSESFNELFEQFIYKINQIILFHINDRSITPDVAQDVLLKIFRYLPYFKEDSQFLTWVYRIIQNTIKNYFRSVSTRIDSEAQFCIENCQEQNQDPERIVMSMEFGEQVELAMAELSDELRTCYGKHIFEGQSYEAIAKQLRCPIGTVRSRIYRARKLMMYSIVNRN